MGKYDIEGELESLRRRKRSKPKKPDSAAAVPEEVAVSAADTAADTATVESEVADIKATWRTAKASDREPPADEVEPEPPASEPEEKPQIYVVKKGDSLSKIAKEVYGNAGRWQEIYDANRDRIDEPNLIRPGWELNIP